VEVKRSDEAESSKHRQRTRVNKSAGKALKLSENCLEHSNRTICGGDY
jgi:hypothetical protein